MSELSFTNFFNSAQSFGLNVKLPEKTMQQIGKTATGVAGGVFEPIFSYLEENENVFSGDIINELNKTRSSTFNIALAMNAADEKVNGPKPSFDIKS